MTTVIDTIIFDLGGVLIDHKPEYLFRSIFKNNIEKMEWFLENVCTSDWNMEQDAGRTIAAANNLKIAEFPEYRKEILAYYDQWEVMCKGPIEGTLKIFEAIKKSKKYHYYALTNFSTETWPTATKLFPFLSSFQGMVISGEVKMRKPFHAIYLHLFEKYSINPKAAIFIDDSKPNVEAARQLGLYAIHFQTPNQLHRDLKALGIDYNYE
jgi:2-haloacid dehalogenase